MLDYQLVIYQPAHRSRPPTRLCAGVEIYFHSQDPGTTSAAPAHPPGGAIDHRYLRSR